MPIRAAYGLELDLSDLVVVHAITGDEFVDSLDYVNRLVLPLLRARSVRLVQICRAGKSDTDGVRNEALLVGKTPGGLMGAISWTYRDVIRSTSTAQGASVAGKQLSPQNATVTMATIQVQALTIGKRQVTLAVFRQLEDEEIIQPLHADLSGEPWGRVNYHPDKCADEKEHIHVVWQKDDELRRATVYEPSVAAHEHLYAGLYVEALIADGLQSTHRHPEGAKRLRVTPSKLEDGVGSAQFIHRGVLFEGPIRNHFAYAYPDGHRRQETALWRDVHKVAGPEATAESIAEHLPALGYTRSWQRLKELPQLFIAV
ncbi:hypothetical protein [Streptomyces sp. NPDC056663]|uniref:hypothetical protein n=1 Tax=Streptomyces sp. NPDC056663 TaxID=3345899 RepID=UPI0036868829